jgi:hypothetical protein
MGVGHFSWSYSPFSSKARELSEKLKYIWSPWRMDYIKDPHKDESCVFCLVQEKTESVDTLVVVRRYSHLPDLEPLPLHQRAFDGGALRTPRQPGGPSPGYPRRDHGDGC